MTLRVTATRLSARLGVPIEYVREHSTYDPATDTVQSPAGPIEVGFALENLGAAFRVAIEPITHRVERFTEEVTRRLRIGKPN